MAGQRNRGSFWRSAKGSLTVEALLILPAMLLLLALFFRWGLMMREDLRAAAERRAEAVVRKNVPPARRIRDTDFFVDLGYSVKELLPQWIHAGSNE